MPNLTLPSYGSLSLLRTHMRTSLGSFYIHLTNRLLLYFVLGGIFILQGLLALAYYKGPSSRDGHTSRNRGRLDGSLTVSVNNRILEIPHPDISHITVEDHDSRIYFTKEDTLHNAFIRRPLKVLQQFLPRKCGCAF